MAENQRSTSKVTLFDLPEDDIIVTHIGQYLLPLDIVTLAQCSQQFQKIAEKMFRRTKIISKNNKRSSGNWDINYVKKCRCLRKVSFRHTEDLTDDLLIAIILNNPKLKEISLRKANKITSNGFIPLLGEMPLSVIDSYCNQTFVVKLRQEPQNSSYMYYMIHTRRITCMEVLYKTQLDRLKLLISNIAKRVEVQQQREEEQSFLNVY